MFMYATESDCKCMSMHRNSLGTVTAFQHVTAPRQDHSNQRWKEQHDIMELPTQAACRLAGVGKVSCLVTPAHASAGC